MAKRRRKKPNISKTVLEQARQSADGDAQATAQPATSATSASQRRRRRRDLQSVQLERRKGEGALEAEYVADVLANPSKIVTEAELRADYGFVIKDLRNMGMLAAGLFVALVIVSLVAL